MIKRPLDSRFSEAVREGRKFTTIRDNPWPVGVPIMLYNWSGAAYRSKQINVAAVVVLGFWTIQIARTEDGVMRYAYGMENAKPLHETEGFESREDMDAWFQELVKPGQTISKTLMRFRLANVETMHECEAQRNTHCMRRIVLPSLHCLKPFEIKNSSSLFSRSIISFFQIQFVFRIRSCGFNCQRLSYKESYYVLGPRRNR